MNRILFLLWVIICGIQVKGQEAPVQCPEPTCDPVPSEYDVEKDCVKTDTFFQFGDISCLGCPTYECTISAPSTCPEPVCEELVLPPDVDINRDCKKTEHTFFFDKLTCPGCPTYECQAPPKRLQALEESTEDVVSCPDVECSTEPYTSDCHEVPTSFPYHGISCTGCPHVVCDAPKTEDGVVLAEAHQGNEEKLPTECQIPTCEPLTLPPRYNLEKDCTKTLTTYRTESGVECAGCPIYECKDPLKKAKVCGDPSQCDRSFLLPGINVKRDCNVTVQNYFVNEVRCTSCPIYACKRPASEESPDVCPTRVCNQPMDANGGALSCVQHPTFFAHGSLTCEGCSIYKCHSTISRATEDVTVIGQNQTISSVSSNSSSSFPFTSGAALGIGIAGGFVVAVLIAIIVITITKRNKNYNEIL